MYKDAVILKLKIGIGKMGARFLEKRREVGNTSKVKMLNALKKMKLRNLLG